MQIKFGFLKRFRSKEKIYLPDKRIEDRKMAEKRHDIDSGIFQGRYVSFNLGRFTDEFIYGRFQIFEEIKNDLKKLKTNSKVLDLGSGTGHLSQFIRDLGHEVIGLDPSKEMLKYARKNFPEIKFINGISAELPFEADSFDYVVSIEVLRYLNEEDVDKTYEEIYRVLKPNGFFNVTHVNKFATDLYYFYYHLVKFSNYAQGKNYHNCYFTTPQREEIKLKKLNFRRIITKGRMFATIRIFYKFGKIFKFSKLLGKSYSHLVEIINKSQEFKNRYKKFAGHLIIKGYK